MNVIISKSLRQQVRSRAQKHGVTETAYIQTAIKQAIKAESEMNKERHLWGETYLQDFARFAKKHSA